MPLQCTMQNLRGHIPPLVLIAVFGSTILYVVDFKCNIKEISEWRRLDDHSHSNEYSLKKQYATFGAKTKHKTLGERAKNVPESVQETEGGRILATSKMTEEVQTIKQISNPKEERRKSEDELAWSKDVPESVQETKGGRILATSKMTEAVQTTEPISNTKKKRRKSEDELAWSKDWPRVALNDCGRVEYMNRGINSPSVIENRPYPRTGIVSFPGSGNTWVRHLLQQATGLWTGSVYDDRGLFAGGFKAELESCDDNSTVAVKSHYPALDRKRCEFDRIILVIRDPHRAILAEFNWRSTGQHTGLADVRLFKTRYWRSHIDERSSVWLSTTSRWIERFAKGRNLTLTHENPFTAPPKVSKKLLLVSYERLKRNTVAEMRRMVEFLRLPTFRENCLKVDTTGNFHRVSKSTKSVACLYERSSRQGIMSDRIDTLRRFTKKIGVGDVSLEFEKIDDADEKEKCRDESSSELVV